MQPEILITYAIENSPDECFTILLSNAWAAGHAVFSKGCEQTSSFSQNRLAKFNAPVDVTQAGN